VVQELGVQGVKVHPQRSWFIKNVGKISKSVGKEASTFLTLLMKLYFFFIECTN